MKLTLPDPADGQASKIALVTTIATTPSQRKNGQQLGRLCLTTRHSLKEPQLELSTLIAPYWRKTGSDYPKSKPPSRDVYPLPNNLVSDGEAHEEAPPEAVKA
jgi:hypothetical protein